MTAARELTFVSLGHADAERLAQLHQHAFPAGEAWTKDAFEELLALDTVSACALAGKQGLVSILLVQRGADQAEILTLATDPAARRKGYAKTLLDLAGQDLQSNGAKTWLLDVAADNAGAIAFYEKLGFSQDGKRPRYYKRLEGDRVDAILMSMPMGGQTIR